MYSLHCIQYDAFITLPVRPVGNISIPDPPLFLKSMNTPFNTNLFLQITPWIPPTFLAGLGIVWCSGCPSSSLFQTTNLIKPYFRYISILLNVGYIYIQFTTCDLKLASVEILELDKSYAYKFEFGPKPHQKCQILIKS